MTNTRRMDLRRLNSVTKYPSILTYHGLGEKGSLLDVRNVEFDGLTALVTEKVDGTNSRVILMPDGVWLIGSREELLHASGDLIHNPAMGIVDELSETAGRLARDIGAEPDVITTVYVETYKKSHRCGEAVHGMSCRRFSAVRRFSDTSRPTG